MNIDIVTRREQLDSLAGRWDALARGDRRDGFFRTSTWYRLWLEHVRVDAEPFVIVARDSAGSILGIAPLCRVKYRDAGLRLSAVAWGGREVVSGDFLDFVTDVSNRAEIVTAMLERVWDARRAWGLAVFGELLEGADAHRAVEQMAADRGLAVRTQEERVCRFIALPDTFHEYLASIGSSSRYHIRRRERDVQRAGATITTHSRPDEIAGRLQTLVDLHRARWEKERLPGTLGRRGFQDFLARVIHEPPPGGRCRLYEIVHRGRTAASLIAFHFGDSALYYQAGWDPGSPLASTSPGVVLMAHSIRDAIESGLRYYEFLRGDETYKSRWTNTYRRTTTLLLARSPLARGYLHAMRLKDAVKRRGWMGRRGGLDPVGPRPDVPSLTSIES